MYSETTAKYLPIRRKTCERGAIPWGLEACDVAPEHESIHPYVPADAHILYGHPVLLLQIVRAHMVFVMGARSAWNEDHILSNLPPNIRERVLHHVHRDAVDVIPIFKAKPPGFVAAILRNLRPHHYPQVLYL